MSIYYTSNYHKGFGTFPLKGDDLAKALSVAIETGYRAIDTAQAYENEADVGAIIEESGIPREEFLVTTKVPNNVFSREHFRPAVEKSLEALRTDQIDVLLLHWPPADGAIEQPLELLLQAKADGLCRHVGVSNFTGGMLRRLRELHDDEFVTNQVEFHPLLNQSRLMATADETGIPLSSYCSVARGEVFNHPEFRDIAAAHGCTPVQVVLGWIVQKGVSINTMSTNPENIRDNYAIDGLVLSNTEMARIDRLNAHDYRIVTRDIVPTAPYWD